jgi:hypothetical protein
MTYGFDNPCSIKKQTNKQKNVTGLLSTNVSSKLQVKIKGWISAAIFFLVFITLKTNK